MVTLPRTLRTIAVSTAALVALGTLGACGEDESTTATDPHSKTPASKTSSSAPATSDLSRSEKLITLAQPAEGATVSGSFTASGKANSPEANVPWEVRNQSGKVVLHGFATAAGWMDKLYPWKTKVDVSKLKPGSYTFVAKTDDPSGGEGKAAQQVGATITVK